MTGWHAVAAVVAVVLSGAGAFAQQPGAPIQRPPYSPYLNLLRTGGTTAQNYYGLVRPEIQARQALQGL
ncbi:MAG: hypothetical protein K2V38_09930, partial [Gemmataceae bacterium]|nr:hypothetical protein [Gemmataceae bacterium]